MWHKEIPMNFDDQYMDIPTNRVSFKTLSLPNSETPLDTTNIIFQWIITPFVLENGVSYDISLLDAKLKEYILTVIAPHFEKVRGIYENEKMKTVRLEDLCKKAKEAYIRDVIHKNKTAPLIQDFYLKDSFKKNSDLHVKWFELNLPYFKQFADTEPQDDRLWEFFKKGHTATSESITLFPNHWSFQESLLHSPFLQYLAHFCSKIILTVNVLNFTVRALTFY